MGGGKSVVCRPVTSTLRRRERRERNVMTLGEEMRLQEEASRRSTLGGVVSGRWSNKVDERLSEEGRGGQEMQCYAMPCHAMPCNAMGRRPWATSWSTFLLIQGRILLFLE
jgi:hypothetical protein